MKTILATIDFSDHVQLAPSVPDEAEIGRWFDAMAEHGFSGAHWRISFGGRVGMRSRTWGPYGADCYRDPEKARRAEAVMRAYDPPAVAVRAARETGRKIYLWITLFDQMIWRKGVAAIDPFFATHPYLFTANRRGGPWFGVPSYAHPESRAHMLDLVRECAAYGADGIFLCTRTHAYEPWGWAWGWGGGAATGTFPSDDRYGYGFDEPVVEEFKRRQGVNILREDFDEEAWHRLKGEFFSGFLREIRAALPAKQELWLNIEPDRDKAVIYARRKHLLYKDWETWKKQKLLTGLCLHLGREVNEDFAAAMPMSSLADDAFRLHLWLNTAGGGAPGLKPPEACERMAAAAAASPFHGVVWHQMSDWYYREGQTRPDSPCWKTLGAPVARG